MWATSLLFALVQELARMWDAQAGSIDGTLSLLPRPRPPTAFMSGSPADADFRPSSSRSRGRCRESSGVQQLRGSDRRARPPGRRGREADSGRGSFLRTLVPAAHLRFSLHALPAGLRVRTPTPPAHCPPRPPRTARTAVPSFPAFARSFALVPPARTAFPEPDTALHTARRTPYILCRTRTH